MPNEKGSVTSGVADLEQEKGGFCPTPPYLFLPYRILTVHQQWAGEKLQLNLFLYVLLRFSGLLPILSWRSSFLAPVLNHPRCALLILYLRCMLSTNATAQQHC